MRFTVGSRSCEANATTGVTGPGSGGHVRGGERLQIQEELWLLDAADLRAAWTLAGQAGGCREELRPWPGAWRALSRCQRCRHCCRLYRILLLAPSLGSGHTRVLHPCWASLLPHHSFQGSCGLKCPLACLPQAPGPSSTPPCPRSLPDATPWRNAPFLELPHPSPCNLVLPRHSYFPISWNFGNL